VRRPRTLILVSLAAFETVQLPTSQTSPTQFCRLCKRPAELTEEHVPPKSTGNKGLVRFEALGLSPEAEVIKLAPNGIALKVLCERCNNNYGSRLGTGFGEFAKQVQGSGRVLSPRGGVFAGAVEVFPSRVLKHLYLNYLCAQVGTDKPEWDALRDYVKSRDGSVPTEAPRVSLYFNASPTYRLVPVCGVVAIDASKRAWYGSEIVAPGLGAIFTLADTSDPEPLIGVQTADITGWSQYRFDQRDSVALSLPNLRVEHPHPLGFGRAADVERWRERNMIGWFIGEAEDPLAVNSASVLWQPVRRR
jgi:hypothetical protein